MPVDGQYPNSSRSVEPAAQAPGRFAAGLDDRLVLRHPPLLVPLGLLPHMPHSQSHGLLDGHVGQPATALMAATTAVYLLVLMAAPGRSSGLGRSLRRLHEPLLDELRRTSALEE